MSFAFLTYLAPAVLLFFLAVAGYDDWKDREVPDWIWVVMGAVGTGTLVLGALGSSALAIGLDILGALFALEHVLPWDRAFADRESLVGVVEIAIYLAVIVVAIFALIVHPSDTPAAFLAIVVSVVIARVLFETKLLYGGADAKAMIITAVVVPLWPVPLLVPYPAPISMTLLPYVPLAFTMLVDGALLTLAVPIGILLYNVRHGYWKLPEAFTLYEIPVSELPRRYVWLRRPRLEANEEVDTSAEDEALRTEQMKTLTERGITTVWVTPQLPMVLALAVGALIGLLFGNILFWLL